VILYYLENWLGVKRKGLSDILYFILKEKLDWDTLEYDENILYRII
jgi:hypothetical protein